MTPEPTIMIQIWKSSVEERAQYCIDSEHNTAVGDSLVICRFIQERAFGVRLNDAYIPPLRFCHRVGHRPG